MYLNAFYILSFLTLADKKLKICSISSSIEASCLQSAGTEFAITLSYESDIIAISMFNNRIGIKNENITNIMNCEVEKDYISPNSPKVRT
jgi:hypothetical protein